MAGPGEGICVHVLCTILHHLPPIPSMSIPLLKDDAIFASQIQLSVLLVTSGRISKAIASVQAVAEAYQQEVEQIRQQIKFEVADWHKGAYVSWVFQAHVDGP